MKSSLVALFLAGYVGIAAAQQTNRYEAESAVVDENSVQKVADTKASGGYYINMKEGALSFKVNASAAGFYTLWTSYSQPSDTNGKIQNLSVNGISTGQISFPKVDTFVYVKASSKIKLNAGANTIDITKSWGWVNIDYIEITPYVATPFNISGTLVTPNASENAKKMFGFILENFQKKVISGVMTNTVMQNDGKYTPDTVENQTEVAWIINASGKEPALLGVDFLHATGKNSEGEWYKGYTNAVVSLAENIYKKGGIPTFTWHWQDPSQTVEAFYSPSSNNTSYTNFDLKKAFTDASCQTPNTSSSEYKAIINDLDIIASYLKSLADKGVPVLWRPLHESSGKWFWWGYGGPDACKGLYHIEFDRFINYHHLNNLIWVWVTDESNDALKWYPGDDYVDIIGRDYYYDPRQANHGSLVASFEKLKEMYGGKKIISLSECGSVPFPDDMKSDGAGWAYFMPWYGDYTMDGWAHDNTAADWKKIMNSDYVITLDEMPGWDKYTYKEHVQIAQELHADKCVSILYNNGFLDLTLKGVGARTFDLYNIKGTRIAVLNKSALKPGNYHFNLKGLAEGIYLVKIKISDTTIATDRIIVK